MKAKAFTAGLLTVVVAASLLAGCGGSDNKKAEAPKKKGPSIDLSTAKDGTYTADSASDSHLGKGRMTIVIKNHKITAANGIGLMPDGKVKDETYGLGSDGNKENAKYKKAQIALKAINSYGAQLIETQDPAKVDMIAGATVSYNQFKEATEAAVAKAKK